MRVRRFAPALVVGGLMLAGYGGHALRERHRSAPARAAYEEYKRVIADGATKMRAYWLIAKDAPGSPQAKAAEAAVQAAVARGDEMEAKWSREWERLGLPALSEDD